MNNNGKEKERIHEACRHFRYGRYTYGTQCNRIHFVSWFWNFWSRTFDEDAKGEEDNRNRIQKIKAETIRVQTEEGEETMSVRISDLEEETVGSELARLQNSNGHRKNNKGNVTNQYKRICLEYQNEGTYKHSWTCNFIHYRFDCKGININENKDKQMKEDPSYKSENKKEPSQEEKESILEKYATNEGNDEEQKEDKELNQKIRVTSSENLSSAFVYETPTDENKGQCLPKNEGNDCSCNMENHEYPILLLPQVIILCFLFRVLINI